MVPVAHLGCLRPLEHVISWATEGTKRNGEIRTDVVCDGIEGLGIMIDFCVETSKIETIEDVFLLYFAEILISF